MSSDIASFIITSGQLMEVCGKKLFQKLRMTLITIREQESPALHPEPCNLLEKLAVLQALNTIQERSENHADQFFGIGSGLPRAR